MAKLCSPYGTSPPMSSIFGDLSPNSFSTEEYYISADPFDFLEDLPSIYGDIQKIESDMINGDCTSYDCGGMDLDDLDVKPEIRNTDLMWSAPSILSTSATSMSSDISTAVPFSAVMGNSIQAKAEKVTQQQMQVPLQPPPTVVVAKKLNHLDIVVKQEPDVEQQLAHHSIPNNKLVTVTATMQSLPPGTSLLRKSANQQQQNQQQQPKKVQQIRGTLHIPKRGDQLLPSVTNSASSNTTHSNNNNNSSSSSNYSHNTSSSLSSSSALNTSSSSSNSSIYQRPDTPHSLDDDSLTPEFRHNVDLRACVMGSNNISLTSDPTNFIHHVSQELQDTTKKQIDTRLISGCSLTEVLDVINSTANSSDSSGVSSSSSVTTPGGYSNCLSVNTSGGSLGSSEFDSDEESTVGSSTSSLLDHDITYGAGGVSPVSSQSSNISTHHYMKHSDHSYTRCKDGMDDMSTNLETPSDSEEEIDVVSINDKKLPTNPSDKDRRALQTKVAHKFNAARIVKTPSGIRTIPPRRRGSYEFPYTPASNSPVKSVNNSRFPSPAATPYQSQYTTKYVQQQQQQQQQQQHMVSVVVTDSNTGAPINILSTDKSRKRLLAHQGGCGGGGGGAAAHVLGNAGVTTTTIINGEFVGNSSSLPPTKKHRGKKTKHIVTAVQLPDNLLKRDFSIDETADTIEKRNLHNDMERQRRIGLKNLFEALKKQIPSIKDKERAPKVNILREAAKLCEALTREDQQLMEQRSKLKEELRRKQELVHQLRQQQRD